MNYKKLIITLIDSIDNPDFLEYIYRFAKRLKRNWGC